MAEREVNLLSVIRTSSPPQLLWSASGAPYLAFDGTTDEFVLVKFRVPDNYASNFGVKWKYSMETATSNNVAIRMQVKAVTDGENITTATFDTLESSADDTVPGTAGLTKEISHTITNNDSMAAGDYVEIEIGRENATSGTNASNDMYLHNLVFFYTES